MSQKLRLGPPKKTNVPKCGQPQIITCEKVSGAVFMWNFPKLRSSGSDQVGQIFATQKGQKYESQISWRLW